MAEKKPPKSKKPAKTVFETEKPSVIFLDEKASRPVSLILLGVIAVVMGFLSKTPIMAKTIFSAPADFMVIFGLIGIVAGLILNYRRSHPSVSKAGKKNSK